jgi:hypothetical protein
MGNTVSRSTVTTQLNNMTANILTNISMNCSAQSSNNQVISIDCTRTNLTEAYESNSVCRQCILNVLQSKREEYTRYFNLAQAKELVSDIPNINIDLHYVGEQLRECGKRVCKACVIEDISQSNVVNVSVDCQAMNNISNLVSQSLTNAITQKLTTNYDILGSLANVLGGNDSQSVVNSISNRVKSVITNDLITNIYNQAKNEQTFIVNLNTSGQFNGISQRSTYNSIVTYLSTNNIFNSILSESEWTTLQTLHDSNNITGTLTAGFETVNSLFSDVLKHTIGYILLGVMAVMCLAAFYVIATTVYEYRNLSLGLSKEGKKMEDNDKDDGIKLPYVTYFPKTILPKKSKVTKLPSLF